MKATVLITTFNHEAFIADALNSVSSQRTTFPFDILIADDGSSDGTREILERFRAENPDRVTLFLPPQNMGGNGNAILAAALERCHGDYVAFLEGDDYWTDPARLETMVALLEASPELVGAFHAVRIVAKGGEPLGLLVPSRRRASYGMNDLIALNLVPQWSSSVYRRAVLAPMTPILDVFCSDWAFHLLQTQRGALGYSGRVMSAYRQHESGLWTSMPRTRRLEEMIRFTERIPELFPDADRLLVQRSLASHWAELAVQRRLEGRDADAVDCARRSFAAHPLGLRSLWRMVAGWTRVSRALGWRWRRFREAVGRSLFMPAERLK